MRLLLPHLTRKEFSRLCRLMSGKALPFQPIFNSSNCKKPTVKRFLFHCWLPFGLIQREKSEKQKTLFALLTKSLLWRKFERKGRAVSAHQGAKPFQIIKIASGELLLSISSLPTPYSSKIYSLQINVDIIHRQSCSRSALEIGDGFV